MKEVLTDHLSLTLFYFIFLFYFVLLTSSLLSFSISFFFFLSNLGQQIDQHICNMSKWINRQNYQLLTIKDRNNILSDGRYQLFSRFHLCRRCWGDNNLLIALQVLSHSSLRKSSNCHGPLARSNQTIQWIFPFTCFN